MLEWLGQMMETLGKFFPRMVIVCATQAGVKWKRGKHVRPLQPGLHWYWPITTEVQVIITARQTLNLPPQTLMTSDKVKLATSAVLVYSIYDIVRAIGQANWDVDSTASDIAQAAVVEVISSTSYADLTDQIVGEVEKRLTKTAGKRLNRYGVRVHRCALTDLAECRVYRLIQNT